LYRSGKFADPFITLARASTVTQTLKLETGVCLVPEHNPLLLAMQVATLDNFSGGRFLFGMGAGWLNEETEIRGGDFAHRWGQTREAILAMKEFWSKEAAEFHSSCRCPGAGRMRSSGFRRYRRRSARGNGIYCA